MHHFTPTPIPNNSNMSSWQNLQKNYKTEQFPNVFEHNVDFKFVDLYKDHLWYKALVKNLEKLCYTNKNVLCVCVLLLFKEFQEIKLETKQNSGKNRRDFGLKIEMPFMFVPTWCQARVCC